MVKVFDGVDLIICYGEFLVIFGFLGLGKLILMNVLGCLDKFIVGCY